MVQRGRGGEILETKRPWTFFNALHTLILYINNLAIIKSKIVTNIDFIIEQDKMIHSQIMNNSLVLLEVNNIVPILFIHDHMFNLKITITHLSNLNIYLTIKRTKINNSFSFTVKYQRAVRLICVFKIFI